MLETSMYSDLLREIGESIVVSPRYNDQNQIVAWAVMEYRSTYGRRRWHRLGEYSRQSLAISSRRAYVLKTLQGRILAEQHKVRKEWN